MSIRPNVVATFLPRRIILWLVFCASVADCSLYSIKLAFSAEASCPALVTPDIETCATDGVVCIRERDVRSTCLDAVPIKPCGLQRWRAAARLFHDDGEECIF